MRSRRVVPQQRRRLVQIDDENVEVASLSKSPKAHPRLECAAMIPGPALFEQLLELRSIQIPEQDSGRRLDVTFIRRLTNEDAGPMIL
jgi:hypothetical protein